MAGDVAEAMLDGTLCESCGEFIGSPVGYPTRCTGCKDDEPEVARTDNKPAAMVICPSCQKRVKEVGLGRHVKDAHPESQQVMRYNHKTRGNTPGGQ